MPPRMGVPNGSPDEPGDLARKIIDLINLKRRPDGREFTQAEIAEGVSSLHRQEQIDDTVRSLTARGATQSEIDTAVEELRANSPLISRTYVGKLMSGSQDNPTREVLWYLAQWFGVPVGYFFPGEEAEKVDKELKLLGAFADTLREVEGAGQLEDIKTLLRSTQGMTPSARKNVIRMIMLAVDAARETPE